MTARFTHEVDAAQRRTPDQGRLEPDWSRWRPRRCPAVPKWKGPWNRNISGLPVDRAATEQLADFDEDIVASAGKPPWLGATGGMPITEVDSSGPKTTIWDLSKPVGGWFWAPQFPTSRVALGPHVRREGDPVGAWDRHAYLHDPTRGVLTEMIQLDKAPSVIDVGAELAPIAAAIWRLRTWGQTDYTVGYSGGGPGLATYDLSKPYDARTTPHGVVAAGVPQSPMFVGWEEILAGVIDHCLFLALGQYGKGRQIGWARGTDGETVGHPLMAGAMLRLSMPGFERLLAVYPPGTPGYVILVALLTFGAFLGDKTGGTAGGMPLTQDHRWWDGDDTMPGLGLFAARLTDFEVITPNT